MKRDGANTSLWQNNMPDYTPRPRTGPDLYDVVIVGGGVTGIATGLQLQKAGKKVLIAEAYQICFGTTGGTTAHLNTFFDNSYHRIEKDFGEEAAQLISRATTQALELYRSNIETYQIDCGYAQKDGFLYAQTSEQAQKLEDIFQASVKAGVDVSYTDRIPVPVPFEKAIVYREQAQVHPTRYVYALARAFEEAGGVLIQDCQVQDVEEIEDGIVAGTSQGVFRATYLIYATHIPPGINLLHFRCAPYRSYAIAVELKGQSCPEGLSYDMYDPYHYYRTQEVDGKEYLIIGGEDHKTAHEANTAACFERLEAYARKYFDISRVAFRWSSQFFEPSDGLAYIGVLPGSSGYTLVATGYGGNGMTYSHIAARVLTDLITKNQSEYGRLFDPGRLKPMAGFASFVKENVDVVKEFVAKRISAEKLPELSDLAPGEGRLVKFEGEKLGIYKDEEGGIHAVNPVCTHAKCMVGWNNSEKSWDCPCHGARYSVDGVVLTGPARRGLEPVSIQALIEKNNA